MSLEREIGGKIGKKICVDDSGGVGGGDGVAVEIEKCGYFILYR